MGILTKIASTLKRWGKEGQHTIEYAVLIILIMAGVITMSRYVIRSWNANLKGWEDSASDSLEDPLLEAPVPPDAGGSCTVTDGLEYACGIGRIDYCTGDPVSCAPTELGTIRIFNPAGCQCDPSYSGSTNILICATNDCCCETPVKTGLCSIDMSNPTGLSIPACSKFKMRPTNPDGTCDYGYMGYSTRCGSDSSLRYGCLEDAECLNRCETKSLPVTILGFGGVMASFTEILNGQTRFVNCPPTSNCSFSGPSPYGGSGSCTSPLGSPNRLCTAGVWGPLQDPCTYNCGDGLCDASAAETCNTCSLDCGVPDAYGNCP